MLFFFEQPGRLKEHHATAAKYTFAFPDYRPFQVRFQLSNPKATHPETNIIIGFFLQKTNRNSLVNSPE
jgi:hypothetical protein